MSYTSEKKYIFAEKDVRETNVRCVRMGLVGPNEYGLLVEKIDGTQVYYKYIDTTEEIFVVDPRWKIIPYAPSKAYSVKGSIGHIEICLNPGYEKDYPITVSKLIGHGIKIYIGSL
jgi:hypothetical protein